MNHDIHISNLLVSHRAGAVFSAHRQLRDLWELLLHHCSFDFTFCLSSSSSSRLPLSSHQLLRHSFILCGISACVCVHLEERRFFCRISARARSHVHARWTTCVWRTRAISKIRTSANWLMNVRWRFLWSCLNWLHYSELHSFRGRKGTTRERERKRGSPRAGWNFNEFSHSGKKNDCESWQGRKRFQLRWFLLSLHLLSFLHV